MHRTYVSIWVVISHCTWKKSKATYNFDEVNNAPIQQNK